MEQELLLSYEAIIDSWICTLGLRDMGTQVHSLRVAELSLALGKQIGLEDEQLLHLRRGALLHDLGKIALPDVILNKPGSLSGTEWELMRKHPEFGYEILNRVSFLEPAAQVAYCHHENWDGSGYPRGLKAENIPLLARIVSVCNFFDALVSDQPYRAGWSKEYALAYIEQVSGKQFDPDIVTAFLRMMGEH